MTTSLEAPGTADGRAPAQAAAGPSHALAGTGTLIRFILRRDRIRLPVWLGAITLFSVASVSSLPDVYLDAADRQARAELMSNPGTAAISGPGYGLDNYTFGAMAANELFSWIAIFAGLMSILLMVRHTRAEEETGRAELVRAAVVGRHASTTAALVVVGGGSLLLGALLALGLGSLGLEGMGWPGSWLLGAGIAAVGLVFAAVTLVTVQLNEHARGAGGLAGAVFAVAFLLRAAGDMSAVTDGTVRWLSWLSPIGWGQQTRAYVDDRWWPLLLAVALTTGLVALAFRLSTQRDVGAAMIGSRPGAAVASRTLSSPLGLAWRQHRTSVMWWSIALFVFALGYGTLVGEVESFAEDLEAVQDWVGDLGSSLVDGFLSVIVMFWATAVAVFATLAIQRPRSEETSGRAEPVLATAVPRFRWVGSHLAVALVGSVFLLLLSGLGLGATAAASLGDASVLPEVVGAMLAYAPAVWVVIGLAVALFGVFPRGTLLVWLLIAYSAVIVNYVSLLGLPDWVTNFSPFGHVPSLPAENMNWAPLVILTALAAALIAVGLIGFRRRDLETK